MANSTPVARSDQEIFDDIQQLTRDSFPLALSRGHFFYTVNNGVVSVRGNIGSRIGYELFVDNLSGIDGVVAVDDRELYDDDSMRIEIGKLLPKGLRIRVYHGVVSLTGRLAVDNPDVQEAIARIGEMPGVTGLNTGALRG